MNLRVRGPGGQGTLPDIKNDLPLEELLARLEALTGVPTSHMEILAGFPPKPLNTTAAQTVRDLGIQPGDPLTIRKAEAPVRDRLASDAPASSSSPSDVSTLEAMQAMDEDEALARAIAASLEQEDAAPGATGPSSSSSSKAVVAAVSSQSNSRAAPSGGDIHTLASVADESKEVAMPDGTCVVRRVIDSDNSCLFNAVGYTMEGLRYKAPVLRQVIVEGVLADPVNWSEAVLGKSPREYCAWIDDPHHWGGAIELSILAKQYERQIAAFDIQTERMDLYGSDQDYKELVMVLYDGLHYDALAVEPYAGAPEQLDITRLPVGSARTDEVLAAARRLVRAAHEARQFTDTASFTLRCGRCGQGLKGEKEAVEHAKATGHSDFTEY